MLKISYVSILLGAVLFTGCGGGGTESIPEDSQGVSPVINPIINPDKEPTIIPDKEPVIDPDKELPTLPSSDIEKIINSTETFNERLNITNIQEELGKDQEFQEESFIATDKDGNDITDRVVITNTIDTTKPGTYYVLFELMDSKIVSNDLNMRNKVIERVKKVVVVKEKLEKLEDSAPVLVLKGDEDIEIYAKGEYVESGYLARDKEDGDITSKVKIKVEKR